MDARSICPRRNFIFIGSWRNEPGHHASTLGPRGLGHGADFLRRRSGEHRHAAFKRARRPLRGNPNGIASDDLFNFTHTIAECRDALDDSESALDKTSRRFRTYLSLWFFS